MNSSEPRAYRTEPLISHIHTADPAVHVFGGRIYLYPSRDIPAGTDRTNGNHFAMRDYHVFSMDRVGGPVTDHGVTLDLEDVPWASRQLWAPDAAEKDGRYYLYFPARDKEGLFRIGVAVSDQPTGPFRAQRQPIEGTYSIDPAVFRDDDGTDYLYFGGIGGGELVHWKGGKFDPNATTPGDSDPAVAPRVARLNADMLSLDEPAREIDIVDEEGIRIYSGDGERRFFESCWMHKFQGVYYFSYSTGTTHKIAYATGASPYGPFAYRGVILEPVAGWTTHQSIVEIDSKWWLFYHDSQLSGQSNLRNVKVTELRHLADGSIETIDPFVETSTTV